MPRPRCCRRVAGGPPCAMFKPAGIPASSLEAVTLTVDEFEALRLADFEGLYQEDAAKRMNVSRQTFGRIIESARKKTAGALVGGKALKIEGGVFQMAGTRKFVCANCRHKWEAPFGTGRPPGCPKCRSRNFHRVECERGPAVRARRRLRVAARKQ